MPIKNSAVLLVSLLVVFYFCFTPVLKLNFLYGSDDDWILLKNCEVYEFSFAHIPKYFTTIYNGQYSPINTMFYGLIFKINGFTAYNYYLALLIVHSINALLIFLFFMLLPNLSTSTLQYPYSYKFIIAYLCAITFYIHPIQIESYTWISASKVILYSCFILFSIIAYLQFLKNKSSFYYCITFFFFILSCGCKEQAVILPIILLLLDYYTTKGFVTKTTLLLKIPFLLGSLILGICQISFQKLQGTPVAMGISAPEIWANSWLSFRCVGEYYMKTLMPVISFNDAVRIVSDQAWNKYHFFYFLSFVCLFYLTYFAILKKKKEIVFGILFTFITLIFTLPIFPIVRSTYMADRYMYLGCVGLFYPVYVYTFSEFKKRGILRFVLAGFYILYLFTCTYFSCINWSKIYTDKSIPQIQKSKI